MRCCSFRVRLYIRLDLRVVCVCMRACMRACVITNAPRFTCGACACIPRCTCTNCRTIRVQTLSLSSFSPSFSSHSLPPSFPTYLPPFYALPLSLSLSPSVFRLFFLAFLRLAQHIRVRVSRFPVCTRTRRTHRQLQPLSVLFYSHPRRSIVGFFVTVMV